MQDDFDDWPPRLIIRTDDPALGIADVLPPSIAALLLRSTKLNSGLQVLSFDGMGDLRLIARRLVAELGPRAHLARMITAAHCDCCSHLRTDAATRCHGLHDQQCLAGFF